MKLKHNGSLKASATECTHVVQEAKCTCAVEDPFRACASRFQQLKLSTASSIAVLSSSADPFPIPTRSDCSSREVVVQAFEFRCRFIQFSKPILRSQDSINFSRYRAVPMSTPVLSHRLPAFASRLFCARTEELRGIFPCNSLVSRGFVINAALSESCRQGRTDLWVLRRKSPVSSLNCRRFNSNGVRARASDSYSDAELDPRRSGDNLVRVISKDAEISVLSLVATEVVREAQQRHNASPTACAALGRALMGTLLLGALKGDAETVQVTFLGDGPLGQMTAVSADGGYVKGFVGNPLVEPLYNENGKLSVGLAVGSGVLSVVRNNRKWDQPYTGTVPIYSGEVAEDIAHYLADSEQMNSALGLGVGFDKDIGIKFAGGFLVQILPFCSEETLDKLEENILKMRPVSDAPSDCKASDIVEAILDGIGVGDYNNAVVPRYGPCGVELLKPRMLRAVASLGPAEVKQILDEQGSVEVRCEYCGDVAQFNEADLQEALQSSS